MRPEKEVNSFYYLAALASAYMQEEQGKVASEYLNTLSEEQLATKETGIW